MPIKVAHIWDDYLSNSFVEVHPLFKKCGFDTASITVTRRLWLNENARPDATVFSHRTLPYGKLLNPNFFQKVRAYLERRIIRGAFLRFAKRKMREEGSDIVHFHFGFTAAQYPELGKNRPFFVTFYGSDVSSALRSDFWTSRYREVLPKAAALLVLCEEAKARLEKLGCPGEKIHVWNLPAGVEKYPYLRVPNVNSPPRMITTARFVEKKGHGLLLEAFSLLAAKGQDFRATLLGYGDGIIWVKDELTKRNLSEKVQVVDTQCQGDFATLHYRLLKEHDLFVLPSITAKNGDDEGGPALSMVCAQAAGLPVICTRFPGSEITMNEGQTGHYLAEATPECLAATLEKIFQERSLWESMGKEGSRLATENFGEREQVAKLVKLYEAAFARIQKN